jgi:hypothetical protein
MAVKFETKCSEGCTYKNKREMYTEAFSHLAGSSLAVKHLEPVRRNSDGEIVDEKQALGLKSEYEMIYPELVVFVNEVGTKTSQTKDGQG